MIAPVLVDVDLELATRLRLAIGRVNRRLRLATNDLPPLQLSVLVTLEQHGPLRLGEVARHEAVSPPTITRVLAALERRGLVDRATVPGDARSVRISLSAAGAASLASVRSERAALLGARLARLNAEQRHALEAAIPALEALVAADTG